MTFQEEQELFKEEIERSFISLFELIENIKQEQHLEPSEAGLYLLTRLNNYFSKSDKQICYWLLEPPFKQYSLPTISHLELLDVLKFISNNGRFRSIKKAKKYGLLLSELDVAFSNELPQREQIQIKEYNQSERETHLQMIAILAEELAKISSKYKKANGLPNNLALANIIETRAKEIEIEAITARSLDTYRKRLTEISKLYKGE